MIPLKLQLKNFLSYGPELQTVDFSPYPLICLSGKNGHGKSALLDAITWALWGQARKTTGTAKADIGLLHLGQTQMLVILDFEFNGQIYRVRREFAKTYGKPLAALDFGIVNQATDQLIPLTDKTIKATQDKIEQMLNLDMESFTNSAFLRQGQANEFSQKTPKDRKRVLATILGLNRFETIRMRAQEKVKDANQEKALRTAVQEKRVLELAKKADIALTLETCSTQLKEIETKEKDLTRQETDLVLAQKKLIETQKKFDLIKYEFEQGEKQKATEHASVRSAIAQWRLTHKKLLAMADSQLIEEKKKQALEQIKAEQNQLQKSLELKEKMLAIGTALNKRILELKQAYALTVQEKKAILDTLLFEEKNQQKQIADTTAQAIQLRATQNQLKSQQDLLVKKSSAYTASLAGLPALEKQFEKRREYYQRFIAQGNFLKQELSQLSHKKKLVHDENNPSCPLCEQNLSASRKRFLKTSFDESEQFLQHRLARLVNVIANLKELLLAQHEQLKVLKTHQDELNKATIQLQECEKQAAEQAKLQLQQELMMSTAQTELKKITDQILKARTEYELIQTVEQKTIDADGQYAALITQLKELDTLQKSLSYDPRKYQLMQAELARLEEMVTQQKELLAQQPLQAERAHIIRQLCSRLKEFNKQQAERLARLNALSNLEIETKELNQQEFQLAQSKVELTREKEVRLQEKGSLENQHAKCALLEKEFTEEQTYIAALTTHIDDYHLIAAATGKDGIQALLIEEAIPEIEHETNKLLAKLTNNQAQIFIESLRDLQKGGTKETLDIKISDSVGIRPYEMFSGGEAFRIDFALRIAISKLLARRAGTSLQTLIIDEGFGSQDDEGLNNIMDALYKIQDDFAKVIIVSHLPAMKDHFPVHLVVEKNGQGSYVRVMEQG